MLSNHKYFKTIFCFGDVCPLFSLLEKNQLNFKVFISAIFASKFGKERFSSGDVRPLLVDKRRQDAKIPVYTFQKKRVIMNGKKA